MRSLNDTQLKLYRTVLVRTLGKNGLQDSLDPTLIRQKRLPDGRFLTWKVMFDRTSGDWVISYRVGDGLERIAYREKVLADIVGEISVDIYLMEQEIAEREDEEQAALRHEAMHIRELEKIGALTDEELLIGYEDALVKDLQATDCVQEWSWHPAYTGEDDPGLEYYEEQSELASEIRDAYESEMKRRGLYDHHRKKAFDRARDRRN